LRNDLISSCQSLYGSNLVSLAIFGSWARETATPVSDVDLLVVSEFLPSGRLKRMSQFQVVEEETLSVRQSMWEQDVPASQLSPVIKTPDEVRAGSPLFLDMTDWCDILWDRDGFLAGYLDDLRARMKRFGSRRRQAKGGYYWEYKPGMSASEVVEL